MTKHFKVIDLYLGQQCPHVNLLGNVMVDTCKIVAKVRTVYGSLIGD